MAKGLKPGAEREYIYKNVEQK